jgi:hypothetical protein
MCLSSASMPRRIPPFPAGSTKELYDQAGTFARNNVIDSRGASRIKGGVKSGLQRLDSEIRSNRSWYESRWSSRGFSLRCLNYLS